MWDLVAPLKFKYIDTHKFLRSPANSMTSTNHSNICKIEQFICGLGGLCINQNRWTGKYKDKGRNMNSGCSFKIQAEMRNETGVSAVLIFKLSRVFKGGVARR